MRSKVLFIMLLLLVNTIVVAGQGLESYVDSTTHETYEYWKPRYYDSIPVSTGWAGEAEQSFDQMIERYHHKDFEYVESISDKLNFLRSEEHTSELQSRENLVCRLLLEQNTHN